MKLYQLVNDFQLCNEAGYSINSWFTSEQLMFSIRSRHTTEIVFRENIKHCANSLANNLKA